MIFFLFQKPVVITTQPPKGFPATNPFSWKPQIYSAPTLYHCILGVGLPVMMAVKAADWPGSTQRSSVGTWMDGGAEQQIRSS